MKKILPLLFLLLLIFTSCDNSTKTEFYSVTFDSDGGTYTPRTQYVKKYDTAIEPKSPDKASARGFMWWKLNNTVYDFSSPVTEDITLKAEYWPGNSNLTSDDPSNEDRAVSSMKNEVRNLHNVLREIVNKEALTDKTKESTVEDIFGIKDNKSDSVVYLFSSARFNDGDTIDINGTKVKTNDKGFSYKIESAKIGEILSTTKTWSETGATKYTLDIKDIDFKVYYQYYSEDTNTIHSTEETKISLTGTLIKYSQYRYEFSVAFTITNDGKTETYPVLHAVAIESPAHTSDTKENDNVLAFNYRGYTGYIPNITL